MDKHMVIAQVLYRMAVYEKCQKRYILTPARRRTLRKKLDMFRMLTQWLASSEALSKEQTAMLIHYITEQSSVFPQRIDSQVMNNLMEMRFQIQCHREWENNWNAVIGKMLSLIDTTAAVLSRTSTWNNRAWISCFMAFHNFPRVFFLDGQEGLWSEPMHALDTDVALQMASFFHVDS